MVMVLVIETVIDIGSMVETTVDDFDGDSGGDGDGAGDRDGDGDGDGDDDEIEEARNIFDECYPCVSDVVLNERRHRAPRKLRLRMVEFNICGRIRTQHGTIQE